jgi:hypothetical protein
MSYTLTQYQTTPGISRDYVSTFELGSFSANKHYQLAYYQVLSQHLNRFGGYKLEKN